MTKPGPFAPPAYAQPTLAGSLFVDYKAKPKSSTPKTQFKNTITQEDIKWIQRMKTKHGLPDSAINYNYPGANEAYQRSVDKAQQLTEQGIKAYPIHPRDEAKANIEAMQQGEAVKPLPRGKHQVGVNLHWGDWKPGGSSVKELVKQLKIQNAEKLK